MKKWNKIAVCNRGINKKLTKQEKINEKAFATRKIHIHLWGRLWVMSGFGFLFARNFKIIGQSFFNGCLKKFEKH